MEIAEVVQWTKDICSIATCAALIIKPVREWIMGTEAIREGQRCLLRAEIVRMYYRHREDKKFREYEFKLLEQCYKAYNAWEEIRLSTTSMQKCRSGKLSKEDTYAQGIFNPQDDQPQAVGCCQ